MAQHKFIRYSALFLIICSCIIGAFYWNEARKEIQYLCGNFIPGVEQSSVIRQLKTATLSSYELIEQNQGSQIVFSSALNFQRYKCVINFDTKGDVIHASYE